MKRKKSANRKLDNNQEKKDSTELIDSIKVREKKRNFEKISTGINAIDKITKKGFVKGSVNMVMGATGTGKSILTIQFLLDGLKKGERCLYISFEEKKEEVYSNLLQIGFNLEKYEKRDLFFFIEYTPKKVKTMLEEGGGEIESIIITKKISRMGIDSISSFASLFSNISEERDSIISLFSLLRKWEATVLLTSETDPRSSKQSVLDYEPDSIINLYSVMEKNQRKNYLEVLKMRGTNHSKDLYEYDIGNGGIKVKGKAKSIKSLIF